MVADDIVGYRVRRALGSGSVGSVWLARDLGSGRPVVVKRVPAVSVPSPEAFRRDLALTQGLDHPHVARLLEVRQTDREWLLVSEFAPAGSLADLLRRRGPLTPGELVTLASPVAQALAAAHRAGLSHGHLGTGDLVFTADGRPMLTDLGLRTVTGSADQPAHSDLPALAELAWAAGGDRAVYRPELFGADAETAAQRVLGLARPEPINLGFGEHHAGSVPAAASRPGRPRPGRRGRLRRRVSQARVGSQDSAAARPRGFGSDQPRTSRRRLGVGRSGRRWRDAVRRPQPRSGPPRQRAAYGVLLAAAAAAAIVFGIGLALIGGLHRQESSARPPATDRPSGGPTARASTSPPTTSSPAASPSPRRSAAAWLTTLRALDVRRAHAFATLDERHLDAVYVPGSQPWRADRSLLASYRGRSLRVLGLGVRIEQVAVVSGAGRPGGATAGTEVVLKVVDRLIAGNAVDAAGHRTALPPGRSAPRLITLAGEGDRWLISRIVAG